MYSPKCKALHMIQQCSYLFAVRSAPSSSRWSMFHCVRFHYVPFNSYLLRSSGMCSL